jgi:hypothetical protein
MRQKVDRNHAFFQPHRLAVGVIADPFRVAQAVSAGVAVPMRMNPSGE